MGEIPRELMGKHSNLDYLLATHYWEMNFEHLQCDDISKSVYFNNICKAVKQYPDFPDFIAIHRNSLVNIVGYNGHTSYRDEALILLKDMMNVHPEIDDIKKCYARGLYFRSTRCDSLEALTFLDEIKVLYDKTRLPDVIGYYCLGLRFIFNQGRKNLSTDKMELYFRIIESYYSQFPDNEIIIEAYVCYLRTLIHADMLQWNKNLSENEYPKLEKDRLYYFDVLYSLAHRFHNNNEIVESYLDIADDIITSIDDMQMLKNIYNDAVAFSEEYPNDFGDITFNCNEILTKLYEKFDDNEMRVSCLKEMKRIAANYWDERSHWVTDLFESLYYDTEDPTERENCLQMYIDYHNENPWNTQIAWGYVKRISGMLHGSDDLNEKIRLFSIIADWTFRQPGNFYILEEYANSLLNVVYSTKNNPEYSCYKDAFILFKEKFQAVISYIDLHEKKEYIELFGNTKETSKEH